MIDYYVILGVLQTATQDEIKVAYKKLAVLYHPDKNPGNSDAEDRFCDVNEANDTLSDPEKRKKYDEKMSMSHDFDFFRTMFSDDDVTNHSAADFTHKYIKPELPKGDNITIDISITIEELYMGIVKMITLTKKTRCRFCEGSGAKSNKKCTVCGGKGRVKKITKGTFGNNVIAIPCTTCYGSCIETDTECTHCDGNGLIDEEVKFKVRIPRGFDVNKILKVAGKGHSGFKGGPCGDLHIKLTQLPTDSYIRVGNDIYQDVEVTITDLVLGNKIDIPTLKKTITMDIPKLTQPDSKFRLPGYGMYVDDDNIGNLFIRLKLVMPESISEEQEELYKRLRESDFSDI